MTLIHLQIIGVFPIIHQIPVGWIEKGEFQFML